MATYYTNIPGVPGGPIQTSFPVHIKLAPIWRTNVRPGIKARTPRLPVQHETANPNSMAVDDATYLQNGSGGRQASWHMTVDDKEAFIGIPLDEVTWQASDGSGPGNYRGISCELSVHRAIVNSNARRAESQRKAAEIMGKIGARLNATPPARRHHDYAPDKKWCPAQMMNRGEWNRYVDWWHGYYQEEKRNMAGGDDTTWKVGDRFEVIADALNVRVGYGLQYNVTNTLTHNQAGTIIADNSGTHTTYADGYQWVNARLDSGGTGWLAIGIGSVDWIQKATTPAPKPDPVEYAKVVPVPDLLETNMKFEDKYNTAEGITSIDGQEFIFVADIIEFTSTTDAKQYGMDDSKVVKAPFQKGERAIAAWLVKARNGKWYYLLTGEDDEWVRVEYVNTVRVADAPLLGDDVD